MLQWMGVMLQRIRDYARRRPWIEIAAAYAVALPMILAGLSGGALNAANADSFSIICQTGGHSGGEDRGGSSPVDHASCVLCAVSHLSAIVDCGQSAYAVQRTTASDLSAAPNDRRVATFVDRGNYARGPPGSVLLAG
jgi:hypothetical protein